MANELKPEDLKPGDKLKMGRVVIEVKEVSPEDKEVITSIGPVPFSNIPMLKRA